jgi:hypothetical protein
MQTVISFQQYVLQDSIKMLNPSQLVLILKSPNLLRHNQLLYCQVSDQHGQSLTLQKD